jgi:hypothetical protein
MDLNQLRKIKVDLSKVVSKIDVEGGEFDIMTGDFTIPKPEGESESEYISKCMKAIGSEYDSQEQALAVCYAQLK